MLRGLQRIHIALKRALSLMGALALCASVPGLPALAAAADPLRLSEVLASNGASLMLEDGSLPDWIEIENTSDKPVNLDGYALITEARPDKPFAFSGGTLGPGEFMLVYCDGSGYIDSKGSCHAPFKLSASGERIALIGKRGAGVDMVETPAVERDQAYCRDASGAWQLTGTPTPGAPNVISQGAESAAAIQVTPGVLEISEAMSANATYFADENGEYPDYIEIHNISGGPVSLGGWSLSDKRDKLNRWQFPDIALPADGYLAVHCSGADRRGDAGHLHASFKLASEGEEIFLSNPKGVVVSMVSLPALAADQAYSLIAGAWSASFAPSPGKPNTLSGAEEAAAQITDQNELGVYITEILASTNRSDDWIEIYNGSSGAVDLSGYGLSDNASRPRKWQFPSGTVVEPGAYLGVFANGSDTASGGRLASNYRLSAEGGYSVTLSDPSGRVLDRLYVPEQYQNISYGRSGGYRSLRYFDAPTPGAPNSGTAYYGRAPQPAYSTPGGLYTSGEALTVSMSVPEGCRIYYTLDCADPGQSAAAYSGPISITETTILRTRVYGEGYLESYIDTQSYLFDVNNANDTLYVVSLVSDPVNLFSDESGIMVRGPNAWPNHPYGSLNEGANFWMDWEREAHVELFRPDEERIISQGCGVKLHGQFSRIEAQQAFKLIARGQYGSNRFRAPIFSKRDFTEYQSFLLRATGQDGNRARMRDSVLTALAEDTSVYYQETELCVCYLNGQYWGQYNLRERINTTSICQFEGWEGDEDFIDLVKANRNTMQGSNETMEKLLEWVKANDTNTDEAFRVLDSAIDIQNYIEYMALEIYTGNTDTLNVKRYRNARADGKWRWVLFDLDWAFTEDTNSIRRWLTPGGAGSGNKTDNTLFIGCMKNDTFRDRFLTYLGEKMATLYSAESVLQRFEARYEAMKPVMGDHLARWNMSESLYSKGLRELIAYAQKRPGRMLSFLKYCEQLSLSQAQMEHYFGDAMAVVGWTYDQIPEI